MIFPSSKQKGDWRITCDFPECEQQEIIEGFPDAESAMNEARKAGWARLGVEGHQCPDCADREIEKILKSAKGNLT